MDLLTEHPELVMIFLSGQVIVRRCRTDDHVTTTQACQVLSEDERGLLLRVLVNAEFGRPGCGMGCPEEDALILIPPDAPYSVCWSFDKRAFTGWCVNPESARIRWAAQGVAGIDTVVDRTPAIVVERDRTWRRAMPDCPDGTDDCHEVIDAIEAGLFPFDGTWCDLCSTLMPPTKRIPTTVMAWLHRQNTMALAS